jgi:hypothetical protein
MNLLLPETGKTHALSELISRKPKGHQHDDKSPLTPTGVVRKLGFEKYPN